MAGHSGSNLRRKLVAWWLLLLLGRVLTPEAALLRLHSHQHTEEEPTQTKADQAAGKALLTPMHQHCHIEQFYDTPFQPAVPVAVTEPVRLVMYAEHRLQPLVWRAAHLLDGASLRGPPVCRA